MTLATITFYLGKWGCACQFCSDRAKTSDLDVSDGLKSIPAVAEAKNIGSKKFFFFFGFDPIFLPYTPFFDLRRPRQTTDLRLLKIPTKRNQVRNCNQKCAEAKENLQTKSGTLGGAGDPPWWFFRVKFFIRFLDVSPPNKNSQTNGFSPKFPTFFLCKKNQIESDGWTSLVAALVVGKVRLF